MERHSLRALLSGALLIPLLWLGIAMIARLRGHADLLPLLLVWAVVVLAVIAFALRNVALARHARLQRKPEHTVARRS